MDPTSSRRPWQTEWLMAALALMVLPALVLEREGGAADFWIG